ncbi:MAG: copper resistance CopC family protein [Ornithinibacter sp.]
MPLRLRHRVLPTLVVATWALAATTGAIASSRPAQGSDARNGVGVALLAHTQLLATTPEDGSTVTAATEVVLKFSEDVNPDFVKVVVKGPGGVEADGAPVVAGVDVTQALAADLPEGTHEVTYRVVSTDGHPVSGSITFTTTMAPTPSGSPSPSPSPSATSTTANSPTARPSASAAPSPTASPSVDETSTSGPSTWQWVAFSVGVLALLVMFLVMAARSDRSASGDRSV